jgi:ferredoxin/predicted transcriptional regulator
MSSIDSAYEKLMVKYRVQKSKYFLQILEKLLSSEQARIVCELPASSSEEIAEKLKLDKETVDKQIQELYEKGVVYYKRKGFRAAYNMYELHDATTTNPKFYKSLGEEYLDLWDKWTQNEAAQWFKENPFPWDTDYPMRIIPKWKSIKDVPGVMPFDDMRYILKENEDTLALNPCSCLRIAKKRFPDIPEEICIIVQRTARYSIDRGSAKKATVKEVLDMLEQIEKYPMVHIGYNEKPVNRLVSNSISCCLVFGISPPGTLENTAPSRFEATVDPKMCIGCQRCIEVCLFDAAKMEQYPEFSEERAYIDIEKCVGCGNCVVNCCIGARKMKLVRPPEFIPDEFEGHY